MLQNSTKQIFNAQMTMAQTVFHTFSNKQEFL